MSQLMKVWRQNKNAKSDHKKNETSQSSHFKSHLKQLSELCWITPKASNPNVIPTEGVLQKYEADQPKNECRFASLAVAPDSSMECVN